MRLREARSRKRPRKTRIGTLEKQVKALTDESRTTDDERPTTD